MKGRFSKAWSKFKGWARRWRKGGNGSGGGTSPLTAEEKKDLLFMREEEKLARDVYITLGEIWGHPIFHNISNSEQRHMDAILNKLNKYGLEDPAANTGIGEFQNKDLQDLFYTLVERGKLSLKDALEVGVYIEETDITDITDAIQRCTKDDIIRVYNNLLNGSRNHLSAFNSQLSLVV